MTHQIENMSSTYVSVKHDHVNVTTCATNTCSYIQSL